MRVPIRKGGKYTHLKPDPHLTEAKFNELKNKLERLKKAHPRLASEVKRLAEFGDFSENAEYQIAKGRLRGLNQGIMDLEEHLKNAIIIKKTTGDNVVRLGGIVVIEVNKKAKEYQILGSSETDPLRGIISHNSPIGSALLGRHVGEAVKVKMKDKIMEYKIIEIK